MLFPFLRLYLTRKFGVGMTEVGNTFCHHSLAGFVSSTIGGALTDRFGRKGIVIFGLVALPSPRWPWICFHFRMFFVRLLTAGILGEIAGPAHNAMVADILPEKSVQQGYASSAWRSTCLRRLARPSAACWLPIRIWHYSLPMLSSA